MTVLSLIITYYYILHCSKYLDRGAVEFESYRFGRMSVSYGVEYHKIVIFAKKDQFYNSTS